MAAPVQLGQATVRPCSGSVPRSVLFCPFYVVTPGWLIPIGRQRTGRFPARPRPPSGAISVGTAPTIAIPVAANLGSVAVIVGPAPQARCNDCGHSPPFIAIRPADDCGSLQLAARPGAAAVRMGHVPLRRGIANKDQPRGPDPILAIRGRWSQPDGHGSMPPPPLMRTASCGPWVVMSERQLRKRRVLVAGLEMR